MYIPNDVTQNYLFCRLKLVETQNTHLNELTNKNSIKFPKVIMPTNKKTFL